jgi:hypothetical protein
MIRHLVNDFSKVSRPPTPVNPARRKCPLPLSGTVLSPTTHTLSARGESRLERGSIPQFLVHTARRSVDYGFGVAASHSVPVVSSFDTPTQVTTAN